MHNDHYVELPLDEIASQLGPCGIASADPDAPRPQFRDHGFQQTGGNASIIGRNDTFEILDL